MDGTFVRTAQEALAIKLDSMGQMIKTWIPKNSEEAYKRAAGRRRYHARRRQRRDERQLIVMALLTKLGWPGYGIGRVLAKALSLDPATISRDLKYLRAFRARLLKSPNVNEEFADAIIQGLVTLGIHPRFGYVWKYNYNEGFSSLSTDRVRGGLSAERLLTVRRVQARVESNASIRKLLAEMPGGAANAAPQPEGIKNAKARRALAALRRMEIKEREIPNPYKAGEMLKSTSIKVEMQDALKAAKKLTELFELGGSKR
jgi:hypothetical protein